MPKLKTNKAAVKRFRVTKNGKIMRYKAGKKHILEHKTSSVLRGMNAKGQVHQADLKRTRKLLHI